MKALAFLFSFHLLFADYHQLEKVYTSPDLGDREKRCVATTPPTGDRLKTGLYTTFSHRKNGEAISLLTEERFQGLVGKPLDLLSLFLPLDPVIFSMEGYAEGLSQYWPKAQMIFSISSETKRVDLVRIHLDFPCDLTSLPLATAKAIYLEATLYPYEGTAQFIELAKFLERMGFFLLTRWNGEAAQTNLIFVRRDYFYNLETEKYLNDHFITLGPYGVYDLILFHFSYFPIHYYLDDEKNDSVKCTLRQGCAYEGNLSLMISELTKPNTLAIDIGAHIGVHTLFMSLKTGSHGAVISFEPNKKLYMEHLANLELNACKNVIPICKGLGDTYKTVYQRRIEIEQEDPIEGEGDYIDIVPLDSYHLKNVSLIKIDVENYEYFVFQGAKETILKNKPVILFECWIGHSYDKRNQESQRNNFQKVMALVESYGYEIYVIYNCDFVAIPMDTKDELLLQYKRKYKRLDLKTYEGGSIPVVTE